jgi:hypothetical protein
MEMQISLEGVLRRGVLQQGVVDTVFDVEIVTSRPLGDGTSGTVFATKGGLCAVLVAGQGCTGAVTGGSRRGVHRSACQQVHGLGCGSTMRFMCKLLQQQIVVRDAWGDPACR